MQSGDNLQLSFWNNPELNARLTVGKDGGIEVPIIGRIAAAGLTVDGLRDRIISQMALYNKLVTQLSVTILDYGSNLLYVTGQVRLPGRYSFEEIPGLWDILLEAGGHLQGALLDEVTIVRTEGNGQVFTIDLSAALRNGELDRLPKILPGDAIHMPGASASGSSSPLVRRDEVYIMGAVGAPGAHKLEPDVNLVEAIGRAGGPLENSDLSKVRYVSASGRDQPVVLEFDLENYFKKSKPHPVKLKAGDTIYIPWRRGLPQLVGTVITTVVTTLLTAAVVTLVQ